VAALDCSRGSPSRNFAAGLINFVFDPDYAHNGVFYTLHMEDPAIDAGGPEEWRRRGLDLTGYTTAVDGRRP
jgi:hypothetical protein